MGNTFTETLKKDHTKPDRNKGRGAVRRYVEEHYNEIRSAIDEGYTYDQVAQTLSGLLDIKVSNGNLCSVLSNYKLNFDNGCLVKYKIGAIEQTLWREFETNRDIEKYVEDMAVKASNNAGYKITSKIISIKKMTRKQYEKSTRQK